MVEKGELDSSALAVAREIYDEPLPVLHWKLYGPFPRRERVAEIEGPAGNCAVGAAPPALEVDAAPPHGFVDLRARLGSNNEVVAYALATVPSPVARTARCALGSDDGVILWVNGAKLHENPGDRGWTPDQDRLQIPLSAGDNVVLLRVEQAGGDWSFNLKVSDVPVGPLFEEAAAPPFDEKVWRESALANAGDPARGRALFFAERGAGCFRCHPIAGEGPKLGPDLRDLGTKYPRAEIVQSILEPSQRILEGYTATHVFLEDGDVLSGLVTGEKDGFLSLADAGGAVREIPLPKVKEKRTSKLSAMPAGLAEKFTPEEFADLVAWLESLKQ
jgi:putative heme-binding domain-containing protein